MAKPFHLHVSHRSRHPFESVSGSEYFIYGGVIRTFFENQNIVDDILVVLHGFSHKEFSVGFLIRHLLLPHF